MPSKKKKEPHFVNTMASLKQRNQQYFVDNMACLQKKKPHFVNTMASLKQRNQQYFVDNMACLQKTHFVNTMASLKQRNQQHFVDSISLSQRALGPKSKLFNLEKSPPPTRTISRPWTLNPSPDQIDHWQ